MIRYFAAALAACFVLSSGPAPAQDKITVFWNKGFYKAEDDALFAAVKKFEDKTKVKVDLSTYAPQDMIPKTVAAMDSGTPPDVAYGDVFDFQVAGKWAFEGKLEDISDIINSLKAQFAPNTIETTAANPMRMAQRFPLLAGRSSGSSTGPACRLAMLL